ncbi:gamma-glutamyltransferase [Synechococcus sp. PCC 7335]|uniref:gamma-glutamyltransferase n=1 Tax=Synechococcus sp. (strain ATCC 29403 / PCC 7335) TaxID=91464 RepID=UPI00017EC732|nr:gamma-glutamyltransferase [Synechococcus sp. PCC 7335]EDX87758.1 gamma-glutamyltransferase [Synechococcus sp. PCC 7335]
MTGVVAAGHELTAEAGKEVLSVGGNAFDGAIASLLAACVVEPTLTSLGGGGFLLAHQAKSHTDTLFDFFTQTPKTRSTSTKPDFYPIEANFGDTIQEFHIGLASIAVPGLLAGALAVHKKLGRLPLKVVAEPAIAFARKGVTVSDFQGYCYELLDSILMATPASREIYAPRGHRLLAGEQLQMTQFADTLEYLASLGDQAARKAFYEGEIAQQIVKDAQAQGGYLTLADFRDYHVIERVPLKVNYRGVQMLTNPPPSAGGALIAFCLELLNQFDLSAMTFGSAQHLTLLSQAMRWTNEARRSHLDGSLFDPAIVDKFLAVDLIEKYAKPLNDLMDKGLNRWGSTTHISVMDDEGNAASVTSSNGEGASYVVPGTQIMLNNMLGEEDLNPHGFNSWPLDQRMSSMMAPTIILKDGRPQLVLGSGGSNRIRSAILQVICNVLDFGMSMKQAVEAPRIHWENGVFHLEPELDLPVSASAVSDLTTLFGTKEVVQWQQANMFFGGVHTVGRMELGLEGAGDPRRSGAVNGKASD